MHSHGGFAMFRPGLSLILALVGLLVGCSSVPYAQRQQQRQAAYLAAAGAPVTSFHFFTLWSWEPLSDSELVVYTRPSQAWLLDLDGHCENLEFTHAIGLTSSTGEVWTRFDKVLTGRHYLPCTDRPHPQKQSPRRRPRPCIRQGCVRPSIPGSHRKPCARLARQKRPQPTW